MVCAWCGYPRARGTSQSLSELEWGVVPSEQSGWCALGVGTEGLAYRVSPSALEVIAVVGELFGFWRAGLLGWLSFSQAVVDPSLKEWRDAGRERMEGPPPCSSAAPPGRTGGAPPRHPSRVVASEAPPPLSLAPAGFRLAAPEELRLGTHLV